MNAWKEGWFTEESNGLWDGESKNLKVKQVLYHKKSEFQDVLVFESESYGNVLALDGAIQATEKDECAYQEMACHLPLVTVGHEPKRVCIIGGGDGGCVREVLKHSSIEEVVLCEIDKEVIEAAKKFLPTMSCGLEDPRVKVINADGAAYLKQHKNYFDVIINDCSDPIECAQVLFSKDFFITCREALVPNGIFSQQSETLWLHLDFISNLKKDLEQVFDQAKYAYVSTPTYPGGLLGFLVCSTNPDMDPSVPRRIESWYNKLDEKTKDSLKYYTDKLHTASFHLPAFAAKKLNQF
ncbi:spermidine synthase [Naegleria gruberi]|uniref:Spermidine synthase n=1 Tax=Naegleria gruberi TaxID=5762 RepID=D2UZX3_NAEGR|nr:spermidine synthase [Naegleria gruberi]EFC50237.1 spermidine synthase [Naegleria gruberi]|eukprot:XP_002682981.1 spermidine synthase [Naegleria gruberi strain NEG-M]